MPKITIYGASDDLLEVEGYLVEEYNMWNIEKQILVCDEHNEKALLITASFGRWAWQIGVHGTGVYGYPDWPIRFTEAPYREDDPAVEIDVPEHARLIDLNGDDDE